MTPSTEQKHSAEALEYNFTREEMCRIVLDHVLQRPEVRGVQALKMHVNMTSRDFDPKAVLTFKLKPASAKSSQPFS